MAWGVDFYAEHGDEGYVIHPNGPHTARRIYLIRNRGALYAGSSREAKSVETDSG